MRTGLVVLGCLTLFAVFGSAVRGNGAGAVGMALFAIVSFWRANCKESNGGWEFLGFVSAFIASGGLIMLVEGKTHFPFPLVFGGCLVLAIVFFIMSDKKEDGETSESLYSSDNSNTIAKCTNNEPGKKSSSNSKPEKLVDYMWYKETMYERLKRLCNPAKFVDNYDKEKVDVANSIYSKLMSIDQNDEQAIEDLAVMTENDLHINLLDEYQFTHLKNCLNPKKYMEPYDADSVTLANGLYSQLMQSDLNYTKYVQIKREAMTLLKIAEEIEEQREQEEQKKILEEDKKATKECVFWLIMMLIVIVLFIILGRLGVFGG